MFASLTNRAGRRPRFSSASWMPVASGSISRIRSVAQATLAASSARVVPDGVEGDVGVVLDARRPCPAGVGPGPQFIQSMCDGAAGIVSAIRRMPGSSSSTGAWVHMLSTS